MTIFLTPAESYFICTVSSAAMLVLKILVCPHVISTFENSLNVREILTFAHVRFHLLKMLGACRRPHTADRAMGEYTKHAHAYI